MTLSKANRERKLPIQQLSILAICRFAEPIASTSLLPYLPEMMRSLHIAEPDVGKWAGRATAIFFLSQACVGIGWGRFADVYGRKLTILIGLCGTMITSLIWGFSRSLGMAIAARAAAGAVNGNVGIIRTTVAEMVPFKELQPRAFSIMPLVWNIGSIFGPMVGGALANPLGVEPGERIERPSFLERFPYSPPNIVSACFFAVSITVGFLFLEETLETLQGRRDIGLRIGDKITALAKSHVSKLGEILRLRDQTKPTEEEEEPLLKDISDEEDASGVVQDPPPPPPSFREVLTYQSILNLVVYTLLALHTMAFDQLLPVYLQYPSIWSDSPHVTRPSSNPLKFAGGFGLDHLRIGLISTIYGIFGMLAQFLIFPPLARRYGSLTCLKVCTCLFPLTYLAIPFTALLPTQTSQVAVCFVIMLAKLLCAVFAYPCSTIMITNSASSLRVLGTLNGFATTTSALGRAIGPSVGGAIFSAGVKRGYIIAPWWASAAVAALAAVPVFWLVEGEGFGNDEVDELDKEEIDEDEERELLQAQAFEGGAEAQGKPGPVPIASEHAIREEEEESEEAEAAYGYVRGIHKAPSSSAPDDEEVYPFTSTPIRRDSAPTLSRRSSRGIVRRMSIPLGMGTQEISRRYSSNLGQSLGSAFGY